MSDHGSFQIARAAAGEFGVNWRDVVLQKVGGRFGLWVDVADEDPLRLLLHRPLRLAQRRIWRPVSGGHLEHSIKQASTSLFTGFGPQSQLKQRQALSTFLACLGPRISRGDFRSSMECLSVLYRSSLRSLGRNMVGIRHPV